MGREEATERPYNLRCRVEFFEKWNNDGIRNALVKLVILVPEQNDAGISFLNAWLPSREAFEAGQRVEVTGYLTGGGLSDRVRCVVRRGPDERSERHYLQIMSVGVADEVKKFVKPGSILSLKVNPESADEEADQSREAGGSFDVDTRG